MADKSLKKQDTGGSAVELIQDAIANVKANAGQKGLTPQQERACQKLQTAIQLLGGSR